MSVLNVKYSIFHELKTVILPDFGYVRHEEGMSLSPVAGETNVYAFPDRDIAYADASGHINPSGVVVYDDGIPIAAADFAVNYVTGQVALVNAPSGAVTADYDHWTVSVIDGFPDNETLEQADLPIISLDVDVNSPSDYAIGQMASFWSLAVYVDIFATTDPMRLQLMDRVQRGLKKWLPLLDFESQMPLNYDGTINTNFDWDGQFINWMKNKSLPQGRPVNVDSLSEKEKYRASVSMLIKNIY